MPHFKPNMFASGSSVFDNQSSAVWRELLGRKATEQIAQTLTAPTSGEANGTTGWFQKYGHTIGANSPMLQSPPTQVRHPLLATAHMVTVPVDGNPAQL